MNIENSRIEVILHWIKERGFLKNDVSLMENYIIQLSVFRKDTLTNKYEGK